MDKHQSKPKRIFISPPHMEGAEIEYVKRAFDHNYIAPVGPNVDEFEEVISAYTGVKYTAVLSSGTAGIHLGLIILGVERGDEVIVSSFTFSASVNPIVYLGATPVLVDSEPGTWNMDPVLLEEAIRERRRLGKKVKAIVIVHLYGMPANMSEIIRIASEYGIPVIEDAAEALGSRYDGKHLGSFGKIGILSFNGNKIITTSNGGALFSDNKEHVQKARFLATQARDQAPHYQHSHIGYNYRMSNVLAGIGLGQMEVIDLRVEQRRANFKFYKENLGLMDGLRFVEEPDERYFSNRWLTTILIDPDKAGKTREELYLALEDENIESRPLWKPMHQQPVFSSCPAFLNGISDALFAKGLCLPSGSNMSDTDRQFVLDSIIAVFDK
ncbi:MAG: aminotransferase class I/II-fold pyridoxal phosphate-dependent enzyme [Bacteroidia bacterium]|nr:MAG: aminotransferase class I/II-fold pyridoxal phosphate-dependent enzyme [Bacteroidia bacterium]